MQAADASPLRLWLVVGTVILLLIAGGAKHVADHLAQDAERTSNATNNELRLLAALAQDNLRQNDYAGLEMLVDEWGKSRPEIAELRIDAANGFTLAEYRAEKSPEGVLIQHTTIDYSLTGRATMTLAVDLARIEAHRRELVGQLALGGALVAVMLIALTRLLLSQRKESVRLAEQGTALERTMATLMAREVELKALNDHLEVRVRERTSELEEQNHRNAQIVNAAMDGFYVADLSGRIRDCNDVYCRMLGYQREELLQLHIPDIEACEDAGQVAEHLHTATTGGHNRFDTRQRRKDGTLVDVEISATLTEFAGEPLFYVFVSDIGPRKEAEAALLRSRDEAERANAAKSEFLSRMSHELRTPLNAILGFGQLLEIDPERRLNDAQGGYVREIVHAGNHLLELVNEVLDLARIESGRLEVRIEPVAIRPLLDECLTQIAPLAARRSIAIEVTIDAEAVLADRLRLRQSLLNLLSNAVKYNREQGRIELVCRSAAGTVRFAVHDSGQGIPADQLPRLFRPFERLESAYSGVDGSGIGLALAKKLVEGMHGEIGVESTPGVGSVFWFTLPACAIAPTDAPPNGAAVPLANPASSARLRLLYVEDNASNLNLMRHILDKRADYRLLEADDGSSGLAVAQRELPDLILLDINLPDLSGYEVLARLRAMPDTAAIPVVAISANAMKGDRRRGLEAGFDDYLTKPIDIPALFRVLDRFAEHYKTKLNQGSPE